MDRMELWTFNKFILISIAICSLGIVSVYSQADVIIEVGDLGKVRGREAQTVGTKRTYYTFLGIPYAKSTANESRFLPPEPTDIPLPLPPGFDTFDATTKMDCCPQSGINILCSLFGRQSENCLGMHIFTPNVTVGANLPVVVFIHGGAFTLGSGDIYTGSRLLEKDVVVVSPNYRLGVLGFFCLNTESASGNTAMYDLHLALTWVQKYISFFGGNPDSVTIAGQSAGSVAVTHLMLSPLTRDKGLFHRAIAVSGTALNDWGTTTSQVAEEASLQIAVRVGCHTINDPLYDPDVVTDCMRSIPSEDLVDALDEYQRAERLEGRLGFSPVTPIVQSIGPSGGAMFLDKLPEEILEQSQHSNIPLIMGSTRHDGSFVLSVVFNQFLRPQNLQTNATFLRTRMLPMVLKALGIEDKTEAVYDHLSYLYLGDEIKESGNFTMMVPGLIDLHTVFFFKAAEYRTLKLHSRMQANSYWYSFDYKGVETVYAELVNTTGNPVPGGVTHGDDLLYLFEVPLHALTTPDDLAVSNRMVDYWTNFIYTGNPNSIGGEERWLGFHENDPHYVVMNKEDEFVNDFPNKDWQGLSTELMPELFPPITTTTEDTNVDSTTETGDLPTTTETGDLQTTTDSAFSFSEACHLYLVTFLVAIQFIGF